MKKIKIEHAFGEQRFGNLEPGMVFEFQGGFFIKIEGGLAVDLEDWVTETPIFGDDTTVLPRDAKLIINE